MPKKKKSFMDWFQQTKNDYASAYLFEYLTNRAKSMDFKPTFESYKPEEKKRAKKILGLF